MWPSFTEDSLNSALRSFPFHELDIKSKPRPFKPKVWDGPFDFEGGNKLKFSAGMMKVFVINSVAMLSPLVDQTDPVWINWVLHVEMVAMLLKSSFTLEEVCVLETLILDWAHGFYMVSSVCFHKRVSLSSISCCISQCTS